MFDASACSPVLPELPESVPHLRCNALKRLTRRRTPCPPAELAEPPDENAPRTQDRPTREPRCCGGASACGANIVSRCKFAAAEAARVKLPKGWHSSIASEYSAKHIFNCKGNMVPHV